MELCSSLSESSHGVSARRNHGKEPADSTSEDDQLENNDCSTFSEPVVPEELVQKLQFTATHDKFFRDKKAAKVFFQSNPSQVDSSVENIHQLVQKSSLMHENTFLDELASVIVPPAKYFNANQKPKPKGGEVCGAVGVFESCSRCVVATNRGGHIGGFMKVEVNTDDRGYLKGTCKIEDTAYDMEYWPHDSRPFFCPSCASGVELHKNQLREISYNTVKFRCREISVAHGMNFIAHVDKRLLQNTGSCSYTFVLNRNVFLLVKALENIVNPISDPLSHTVPFIASYIGLFGLKREFNDGDLTKLSQCQLDEHWKQLYQDWGNRRNVDVQSVPETEKMKRDFFTDVVRYLDPSKLHPNLSPIWEKIIIRLAREASRIRFSTTYSDPWKSDITKILLSDYFQFADARYYGDCVHSKLSRLKNMPRNARTGSDKAFLKFLAPFFQLPSIENLKKACAADLDQAKYYSGILAGELRDYAANCVSVAGAESQYQDYDHYHAELRVYHHVRKMRSDIDAIGIGKECCLLCFAYFASVGLPVSIPCSHAPLSYPNWVFPAETGDITFGENQEDNEILTKFFGEGYSKELVNAVLYQMPQSNPKINSNPKAIVGKAKIKSNSKNKNKGKNKAKGKGKGKGRGSLATGTRGAVSGGR